MSCLRIIFCTISCGLLGAMCTDTFIITTDTLSCDNCFTVNDLGNFSLMDQVFIEFLPGKHILSRPDSIVFEHVTQVNITGSHSTEVICVNSSGFLFSFIDHLVIFDISFFSCGQHLQSGAALFLQSVPNFLVQSINLVDSTSMGLYVGEAHGVAQILDSVVSGSRVANVVCEWTSSNNPINFTVQNLTLTQGGLGLWDDSVSGGMNILLCNTTGSVRLEGVNFFNNSGHNGGNMRIVSSPHCPSVNEYSLNIVLAHSVISYGRASRGGGLFYTEQLCNYNPAPNLTLNNYISLEVRDTSILNNQATKRGGGMDVSIGDRTTVLFHNLTVSSNHVTSRPSQRFTKLFVGGGLSFEQKGSYQCSRNLPVLSMYDCTFERNSAHYGAGVHILLKKACSGSCYHNDSRLLIFITALKSRNNNAFCGAGGVITTDDTLSSSPHQVVVTASHIESNTATIQASGLMISHAGKSFQFRLHDVLFARNGVANLGETYYGFPSTLFLHQVSITSLVNCTFSLNTGSGVGAIMSWIAVAGVLSIHQNSAAVGSGMNLVSSYLDIGTEAFVTFQQNHASQVGGAIYAFIDERALCFYSVSRNDTDVFQFIDNYAALGGGVVYEQHLSDCTRFNSESLSISAIHAVSQVIPQNVSLVTSDPYQVCSCQPDASFDCTSTFLSLSVIPGSPVSFSVILTDQNGIVTPGFVSSITNNTSIQASFYPKAIENSCTQITFLSGVLNLVLAPENYQHYTPAVYKPLNVFVSMLLCPRGFHMIQDRTGCDCLPYFTTDINLECSALDFTITRLSRVWIGLDEHGNLSVYKVCPFNYCLAGRAELHHTDDNISLCISGRTGRLCGECERNLSLTLGVDSCTTCTSNFVALFLAFGGLGVLLLILVNLLNLTITEGAINGVIFSLAFLHLNRSSLFVEYSNSNVFVIIISWINLDFGINVCFYRDLTPYAKIWLQFIFPIYLYVIEGIVNFTSYKSSKLARVTGARNRLKVMSTIFLLGYMKILRAVITILPSATVSSPHDPMESTSVWLYDGSIEYLDGRHAPLFVVAVLFLAFISLPYNSYFLLFQILDRYYPRFPCQPKRNGIMDAHVGAFKEKCRFWLGLLIFTYTVLVVLYYFTGGDRNINLTALTVTCSFLLLLKIWLRGVYKNKILDYLESAQVFIVLVISAVSLQLYGSHARNVALYLMLTVMFILITATVVYHLYRVCTSEDSTVCADLTKCWSKPRRKTDPWSNDYDKLYSNLSQHDFETDYEDAFQLLPVNGNEGTMDSKFEPDLYPSNWFATPYSVPHFREHPDLLKTDDPLPPNTSLSSNSSEKSTVPEVIKVRSSMLVVDKSEDDVDASLVPCSSSDSLRSQRMSVDGTFVIEDHSEKKDEKPAIAAIKHEDKCDSSTGPGLLKEEDGKKDEERLPSRETSCSKATRRPPICHAPMRYMHHERHSPISKSVILPKTKRICRRPPPGTVCFRCDPSLPLHTKIRRFKVDRNGGKFTINSHDVSLTVPSSAIKEDDASILDMEVGLMLNGPFVFPPHIRPISPIVWICIRNKASLCKPIDITLPHFLNINDQDDAKKLGIRFMKASHHARVLEDGKKRFIFDRIGNDTTTKFSSRVGKLQTRHLCFLCIAAPDSRELYKQASYCLIRVDPFTWNFSTRKREIFFIVTYNMNTCLRSIDDQYGKRVENRVHFQFSTAENAVPTISIKLSCNNPGPKWFLALEGSKQIPASRVDFWTLHDHGNDLESMTRNEMYPPRFKLVIHGRNATEPTIAKVAFTGSQDDLDTDILLEPDSDRATTFSTSGNYSGHSSGSSEWTNPSRETIPIKNISPDNWRRLKLEPHLPLLQNYFTRVAASWRTIGVQLEIKTHILDKIEEHRRDVMDQCTEVIIAWQKNAEPPFLWTTFIEVLTREAINENALAREICDEILARLDTYNFS